MSLTKFGNFGIRLVFARITSAPRRRWPLADIHLMFRRVACLMLSPSSTPSAAPHSRAAPLSTSPLNPPVPPHPPCVDHGSVRRRRPARCPRSVAGRGHCRPTPRAVVAFLTENKRIEKSQTVTKTKLINMKNKGDKMSVVSILFTVFL